MKLINPVYNAYKSIQNRLARDEENIGTSKYRGLTFFWSWQYRHALRDASYSVRKKVHNDFLKAGLKVNEASDAHAKILKKYFPNSGY